MSFNSRLPSIMLWAAFLNNSKNRSSFGIKPNMIIPFLRMSSRSPTLSQRCYVTMTEALRDCNHSSPPDETRRPRQPAPEAPKCNQVMRRAIGIEPNPQESTARLIGVRFTMHHRCTGAVPKEQRGVGVAWVKRARLHLRCHDEAGLRLAAPNYRIGHGKTIQKPGTRCGDVKC